MNVQRAPEASDIKTVALPLARQHRRSQEKAGIVRSWQGKASEARWSPGELREAKRSQGKTRAGRNWQRKPGRANSSQEGLRRARKANRSLV
jgi:hypothetical protein